MTLIKGPYDKQALLSAFAQIYTKTFVKLLFKSLQIPKECCNKDAKQKRITMPRVHFLLWRAFPCTCFTVDVEFSKTHIPQLS